MMKQTKTNVNINTVEVVESTNSSEAHNNTPQNVIENSVYQ